MYVEDEEWAFITVECPVCYTEQEAGAASLGEPLGNLNWYRCRACGWQWSEKVVEDGCEPI
jgi:hypothetical protein